MMRSESTSAFGQPSETKLTVGAEAAGLMDFSGRIWARGYRRSAARSRLGAARSALLVAVKCNARRTFGAHPPLEGEAEAAFGRRSSCKETPMQSIGYGRANEVTEAAGWGDVVTKVHPTPLASLHSRRFA